MKSRNRIILLVSLILLFSLFILYVTSDHQPHHLEQHDEQLTTKIQKKRISKKPEQQTEEETTNQEQEHESNSIIKNNNNNKNSYYYQQPFGSVTPAANSAPFLPKLNIRKLEDNDELDSSSSHVACWDRLGNPQKQIPSWVAPLFRSIRSSNTYLDMYNATEHEPWAALIGWVPTKFMGPQPPGVKANGQVMIPPTRGRDYKFYVKEYNASENWHAVFTEKKENENENNNNKDTFGLSSKHPYVFQLGHKNAIAVCIRERIHLSVRRCSPNPELYPPILIHSCMCRKCDDRLVVASSSKNTQKLSEKILHRNNNNNNIQIPSTKFLEYLFLPIAQLSSKPIQTLLKKEMKLIQIPVKNKELKKKLRKYSSSSTTCIPALSAPWLVSSSVVASFEYEGKEHDLDALLEIQSDHRGHVIVVIFNSAWVDHLYNWIFSAVRNAHVTNFIVATMDDASLTLCKQLRLPCYDAVEYAVLEDDPALKSSAHTRKVSEAMSWIKPRLASAILGRGYGFWMIDLDMSWNADPYKQNGMITYNEESSGSQLVHQCDAPARFSINSGFYDTKPTLMTYLFFNNMMTFTPEENSDQTAMRLFGRYDHSFALYNECLNKWIFDMKCNYKVSNSVKRVKEEGDGGKLIETFEWNMMERDKSKFKWVVHHATCLSGAMAKILYLRTMNAWFLDDLEEWSSSATTNNNQKWCWKLPPSQNKDDDEENTKLVSEMGSIRFSPKYPGQGKTDEKFLQRRH